MEQRTRCRFCERPVPPEPVLSLGEQFVVDFVEDPKKAPKGTAPLDLVLCPNCHLLQLRHTLDPHKLFSDFWYRSGTNEMMRTALKDVVDKACQLVHLEPGDQVLDIGSNDGTLLGFYTPDARRVGVEPCSKLAWEGVEAGRQDTAITSFFNRKELEQWSCPGPYKVVTAVAMFYDLDNPLEFLQDVYSVLAENGLFIIQQNYLGTMLRNTTWDNICHEHLCYYSFTVMVDLLERAGFTVLDVELNEVNGGSFRVYVAKDAGAFDPPETVSLKWVFERSDRQLKLLRQERELADEPVYRAFGTRVNEYSRALTNFILTVTEMGQAVYAYGASTRGTTLLQTLGIRAQEVIVGAADRDPRKVGRYMVGSWTPIVSEEEARGKADYFLVLPYHFFPAIREREKEWLQAGGKFIVPLPVPRVVYGDGREEKLR